MSIVGGVTILTGILAKTDIEARVAAGATQLSMARLAGGQVEFGIGTMAAASTITSVQSMRYLTGPLGMTAAAAKTVCVTAGHRISPPQILAMTSGAGGESIRRGVRAVITVSV